MQTVTVEVQDEGVSPFDASVLNFTGSAVAASDAGSGQANISISGGGSTTIYDESTTISGGGLTAGTPLSLPNSGEYNDIDLRVYVNGVFFEPGIDYNYVGITPRTQVTFVENLPDGDVVRFRVEDAAISIYDETLVVGAGGITTGTNITLPSGGDYTGDDLEVYLNGDFMDLDIDWNTVGAAPRTQIQMTFNLVEGDRLRFRKDSA